jgi:hypothetical protein
VLAHREPVYPTLHQDGQCARSTGFSGRAHAAAGLQESSSDWPSSAQRCWLCAVKVRRLLGYVTDGEGLSSQAQPMTSSWPSRMFSLNNFGAKCPEARAADVARRRSQVPRLQHAFSVAVDPLTSRLAPLQIEAIATSSNGRCRARSKRRGRTDGDSAVGESYENNPEALRAITVTAAP